MNNHVYPNLECFADRDGLQEFEIDGDIYHAFDRKQAEQMHKDRDKAIDLDSIKLDANQLEWDSL